MAIVTATDPAKSLATGCQMARAHSDAKPVALPKHAEELVSQDGQRLLRAVDTDVLQVESTSVCYQIDALRTEPDPEDLLFCVPGAPK